MTANSIRILVALVALALAAPALAGQPLRLLPAGADDQVPSRLISAKSARTDATLDRTPAAFSWALDSNEKLQRPAPFVRDSREYWTNATRDALARGFTIRTTAPGALLRLSPEGSDAKALTSGALVVRKNGRDYPANEAFEQTDDSAALKAAGADFAEGTLVVKLKRELGAGALQIAMPDAAGAYLVHVFEPESGEVLSLTTDKATVLDGGTLTVRASFASASGQAIERVAGVIAAPDGRLTDLKFEVDSDGTYAARVRQDARGAGAGLWEVHTFATSADGSVQRDAKTAFAAAAPGARFAGRAEVEPQAAAQPIEVRVALETASASRYDVGAVLYATDASGALVPASIAHGAAWLEPGARELALRFDPATLLAEGLRAPFELRDLVLTDQAQRVPIEQRSRALRW